MYRVKDLYNRHDKTLNLQLCSAMEEMNRAIKISEVQCAGLSLTGYLKNHSKKRILIFGRVEIKFLRDLEENVRASRLQAILTKSVPAIIVTRNCSIPKELLSIAQTQSIPVFRTSLSTTKTLSKLVLILNEEFAPCISYSGTLVDVFGVGVLLQGNFAIGESETAMGLIERGHRLVADNTVKIKIKEGFYLEGEGDPLVHHEMEIQGIGSVNVVNLHGTVCVSVRKNIDLVVHLEKWKEEEHFYDRSGLEKKCMTILGIQLPSHTLHIKPGRNIVLLIETLALNHRLKEMGYYSSQEIKAKVLEINQVKGITNKIL